jgi:nicotinamidase-related amidase
MKSDKALLVIDVQANMFDEAMPVYNGDHLLQTVTRLIRQSRSAGVPVIFVRNNGSDHDPDKPGTPGWEIHPALKPLADEPIIDKFSANSFHETDLHQLLQAQGVDKLIIAGLQTEYCIHATCQGAVDLGYAVTVVADGHSTFDMEDMTAPQAIKHYNQQFSAVATITEANEITFS